MIHIIPLIRGMWLGRVVPENFENMESLDYVEDCLGGQHPRIRSGPE